MIINENPIEKHHKKLYSALSPELRTKIDGIENLPKEELYLIPIKRKRKPEVKAGTVFAMLLPERKYLYGKVIAPADKLPNIESNFFIVLVGNFVSDKLEFPQFELNKDNITCVWIATLGFWKNGTFFTVGQTELTAVEKNLDIGLYECKLIPHSEGKMKDVGYFVSLQGNKIHHTPKIFALCAYKTIYGIEQDIRKQIILGKIKL